MAEWFQLDTNIGTKPEVLRVRRMTGETLDTVVGRLVLFWVQVDQHGALLAEDERPSGRDDLDGIIPDYTVSELCDLCGGESEFWSAVASTGWIAELSQGIAFPGYLDRFENSAKNRAKAARRKQRQRLREAGVIPSSEGVTGVTEERDQRERESQSVESEKKSPPIPPAGGGGGGDLDQDSGGAGNSHASGLRSNDAGGSVAGWGDVSRELAACGVDLTDKAVKAAKRAGATPGHCLAVIGHWRSKPGAWGAGALMLRLKGEVCKLAPDKGWPNESKAAAAKQSAAAAKQQSAETIAAADEHAAKCSDERKQLDELERELAETIDAESVEAIAERAKLTGPAVAKLIKSGWRSKLLRGRVLRAYSAADADSRTE